MITYHVITSLGETSIMFRILILILSEYEIYVYQIQTTIIDIKSFSLLIKLCISQRSLEKQNQYIPGNWHPRLCGLVSQKFGGEASGLETYAGFLCYSPEAQFLLLWETSVCSQGLRLSM